MDDSFIRPAAPESHPLVNRTYRVPTPSIASFVRLVDDCLFLYITGALIHGRPRMGKTYAIEYIRRDFEHRHPRVTMFVMRCQRTQQPSENAFFSALLHTARHPAQSGTSRTALRGRLLHKIRQTAEDRGDARILLFIDEAQQLREIEYEWLRDLHDELETNGLRLFTFLVGQPQLLAQKSALQAQDREHIVARFMIEELAFRGISSAQECAAVLAGYDQSAYPARSDWSYTRFWLPKAHAAGLRMQNFAKALWLAFEDAHVRAGLDGSVEIPMKYFSVAIESALMRGAENDAATLDLDSVFWSRMVADSRFVLAKKAGGTALSSIAH